MHKAAASVFWALWSFPKSYVKAVKCEITRSFLECKSDFLVICYSTLLRPHSPIIFLLTRYYISWPSLMNNRISLYIKIGMRKSKKVMKKVTKAQSKSLRKLLYFHFTKLGVEGECVCWGKRNEWFGNPDAKEHKTGETGAEKNAERCCWEKPGQSISWDVWEASLTQGVKALPAWRNQDFGPLLYGLYAQAYTLFWRKEHI